MSTNTGQNNEEQPQINSSRSSYAHLLAGGIAGTFGAVLTCPLEVIKTRYQSSKNAFAQGRDHLNLKSSMSNTMAFYKFSGARSPSIMDSLRHIIKHEGIPGLFKGLIPNLIGVAPARAIYFFAYGNTKSFLVKKLERETPLVHVTSAAAAGIAMSTCTNPLWFIKTRLQIDQGDLRAIDLIRNVYRENGIWGFYRGISASYVGVSETIVHFVIYEQVKAQLQLMHTQENRSLDDPSLYNLGSYIISAACSKTFATTLCYPHEVVRTRLREEGTKYRTFMQTLKTVYYEENLAGLYRGLLTHLIRQIPNTAIMMSTYELVIAFLLSASMIPTSSVEITTIQPKTVQLSQSDLEVNVFFIKSFFITCLAWHNMDNSRFHCWPSNASSILTETLAQYGHNCKGVNINWIQSPPKQVTQDVPFNVSYSVDLSLEFFDWAIYQLPKPLYTLSNRTMNNSQAWYHWCKTHEPTVDPTDPRIESDACLWHINIHACALGRTVTYCGPWIPPSGEIYHSLVLAGSSTRIYESTVIIPVFGIVEIIAHFKIGIKDWIHIALVSTNIQVSRKAICGDEYCDLNYENCSNCPIDCGKCPLKPIHIGLITTGCGLLISSFIGFFLYFKIQEQRLLWDPSWIIDIKEVQPLRSQHSISLTSLNDPKKTISETNLSITTNFSNISCTQQIFCSAGYLRHTCVAIRKYKHKHFQLTRHIREQVRLVRTFNHNNICKFMGASLFPNEIIIYMEYMPKGSLRDVLQNDKIPITWAFRFSFAIDILNGLSYIHSRHLIHGRLNSSNCVVDQRLTIKITDYGLDDLRFNNISINSYVQSVEVYKRVYYAPELLSINELKLTSPIDIYSFGIILNEIATRLEPFGDDDIESIMKIGYRPKIAQMTYDINNDNEEDFCPLPSSYIRLIKRCIMENPYDRPICKDIEKYLKKMCPLQISPIDLIFKKMSLYQTSLEQAVQLRTYELEQEKHKSENLLYSMLPKIVAEQLRIGQIVTAEYYENCTIYFSDIVGFTTIASRCKPIDIVEFLNRVYTTFDTIIDRYDVYKVETIGDAYMVVSGVPKKNDNEHAYQIATMALELIHQSTKNCIIPYSNNEKLRIRVGLHSGPVCAGVVGSKMPRYCLFGDTVNTASRMESNGEANKIHMTNDTKELLDKTGRFLIEKRGTIHIKGKGDMTTYWLLEELESKNDYIEKNFLYVQPIRLPPIYKKDVISSFLNPNSTSILIPSRSPSPRKTTKFNLISLE
ncbi:unnamed protein product [Rotaria sordida]|uniref:Guanylate cyclase n=2 Tax=Rotaria sordida TaxID=392033 RepID=A0A814JL71_9BILA|nr:unnamed protein product [Rotaria sordida]